MSLYVHTTHTLCETRSLGALRAPTSSWRPFGPAFGSLGLLDFVLRALRPCDPRNDALDSDVVVVVVVVVVENLTRMLTH